jgi:hypothetical protein
MRIVFGLFLLAHGLIHASYLRPAPPPNPGTPEWPFSMARSWLVTGLGVDVAIVRTMGTLLVFVVVVGFALSGLAWLGIVVPAEWWPGLVIGSASASVVLLAAFFHPWIVLGFVIDAVLLWLVLGASWQAELASTP